MVQKDQAAPSPSLHLLVVEPTNCRDVCFKGSSELLSCSRNRLEFSPTFGSVLGPRSPCRTCEGSQTRGWNKTTVIAPSALGRGASAAPGLKARAGYRQQGCPLREKSRTYVNRSAKRKKQAEPPPVSSTNLMNVQHASEASHRMQKVEVTSAIVLCCT